MGDIENGCGWFSRNRVAGELRYNLGTGTNFLINKWNATNSIGSNDHTIPEQWYYAVTGYGPGGWSSNNDPNSVVFNPSRPPYGEGGYLGFSYPYQEVIWGWMAHSESAYPGAHNSPPAPPPVGWNWLWRPTYIAAVPRGIFGLGANWQPPLNTPKPVFHLLPAIRVDNGIGPSIVLQNMTGETLAADVVFYNQDGTFNRRWLEPNFVSPWYTSPYIRVNASSSRTLAVVDAFPGEAFDGYARISASEGIEIQLQSPSYPNKVFLPLVLNRYALNCSQGIDNGGFEEFLDGMPLHWIVSSDGQYSLADGTWFLSGHYGAYLGGYDDEAYESIDDYLRQEIDIPSNIVPGSAILSFAWYMQSQESTSGAYDYLYVRLRNINGSLIRTLAEWNDNDLEAVWHAREFDLSPYAGQTMWLSFEVNTDSTSPTSFFVDNVSLSVCTQ